MVWISWKYNNKIKNMNLHIHLWTSLEYFDLLNEWHLLSKWKKDRELASFFVKNFPWEIAESISPQYEVNFLAIREIKKKFWSEAFNKISGIYYWSDNCEYLIPTKDELEKAIDKFKLFNKNYPPHEVRSFTLVTSYVWDKMLERLEEWLEYLNNLSIKNTIEVVVNDYWVLKVVLEKYTNLTPIFGRLIHKILKTPLVDTFGLDVHPAGELIANKSSIEIDKIKDTIRKWQIKFYSSNETSLDIYKKFLEKNNISRVALDYMEKRQHLFEQEKFGDIAVDLYYPWAIVFTWRLCDTSAVENPVRWYYATDDICPRTCNRYDISYKIKTSDYKLIQRWNSAFRSELSLDYLPDNFIENKNNRLIFSPFITL